VGCVKLARSKSHSHQSWIVWLLRCSGRYRLLPGDFNQSTTLESSAELGCEEILTTICWGIKFFHHNLLCFFLSRPSRPSSLRRKCLRLKVFGDMTNYLLEHLDEIEPTPCPCGLAKRAFVDAPDAVATLHEVDIKQDSVVHYHKRMTEIYLVLEGEGHMELDGDCIPVKPMSVVYIKPGCRHRAVGRLKIINVPIPAFDPDDEWFDE